MELLGKRITNWRTAQESLNFVRQYRDTRNNKNITNKMEVLSLAEKQIEVILSVYPRITAKENTRIERWSRGEKESKYRDNALQYVYLKEERAIRDNRTYIDTCILTDKAKGYITAFEPTTLVLLGDKEEYHKDVSKEGLLCYILALLYTAAKDVKCFRPRQKEELKRTITRKFYRYGEDVTTYLEKPNVDKLKEGGELKERLKTIKAGYREEGTVVKGDEVLVALQGLCYAIETNDMSTIRDVVNILYIERLRIRKANGL